MTFEESLRQAMDDACAIISAWTAMSPQRREEVERDLRPTPIKLWLTTNCGKATDAQKHRS